MRPGAGRISASIKPGERDFHLHLVELQHTGAPKAFTLAGLIALCSVALAKPIQPQMVVLGDMWMRCSRRLGWSSGDKP